MILNLWHFYELIRRDSRAALMNIFFKIKGYVACSVTRLNILLFPRWKQQESPVPQMSRTVTMLKWLPLQTQGTPQLSGDDTGSFFLRFAQKQVNVSTWVKMLGCPSPRTNYCRMHLHVYVNKVLFLKHKVWILCFLGLSKAPSSWSVGHWNGIVDLETLAGPPFMWNCGIFNVPQDM